MKPNHKSFKDFSTLAAAKSYLLDLRGRIIEMQDKLDRANTLFNTKHKRADNAWHKNITIALKCHKQEECKLTAEIEDAEKKIAIRASDFYYTFYKLAERNLPPDVFAVYKKAAEDWISPQDSTFVDFDIVSDASMPDDCVGFGNKDSVVLLKDTSLNVKNRPGGAIPVNNPSKYQINHINDFKKDIYE